MTDKHEYGEEAVELVVTKLEARIRELEDEVGMYRRMYIESLNHDPLAELSIFWHNLYSGDSDVAK